MSSSMILERRRIISKLLYNLIFTRPMGGGPRTFPGGLNKWQWKRMHEKKAKEKEQRLLEQEKQLYQARIRSQIRAKLAGKPDPSSNPDSSSTHGPMSPNDQITALANRFMKSGAIDLWNESDGPLKTPSPPSGGHKESIPRLIEPIRTLKSDRRSISCNHENVNLGNRSSSNIKSRSYSVQNRRRFSKAENSSSDDESDYGWEGDSVKPYLPKLARNPKNENDYVTDKQLSTQRKKWFLRKDSSTSEDESGSDEDDEPLPYPRNLQRNKLRFGEEDLGDEDDDAVRGKRDVGRTGSSASLGKYDVKRRRRVMPKGYDDESNFSEQVEMIRYELSKKRLDDNEEEKHEEESILTQKRFDECGISPLTIKALTSAGYVHMTRVQEASLTVCLEGKDAIVKAKTGTGKSAAFLLPAIEAVLKVTSSNIIPRVPPICVLILCPTRELASQIAAEANVMLKYHDGIGVQTLVGGTRFKDDHRRLESYPSQIIIATPGRLLDHIENKSGLSVRLMGLKMLIVDEADLLLDLGFRRDMEKIVDCLPRQRQSMMFSATIPKEVRRISQLVLKREHDFVDTVGLGCVETHAKVKQSCLIAPHKLHFHVVHHLLKEHTLQVPDYKVLVFCTTGMVTSLMYLLFREMKMNVREMHSRKPQLHRARISEEFRQSKRLILVTSDVSARGMNYPDVTLVLQVGIPSDREQYIHRLGRTGREGKEGEGILLIAPWEEYFLDELKELPLEKISTPYLDPHVKLKMENSMENIDGSVKEAAYHAWLGYYNSIREIGRDKTTLVDLANQFSESIGLRKPPALFRKTALKMGLKDIPGIRIRK